VTPEERFEQEARLRILLELAEEPDRRMAVARLRDVLRERWAINRSQGWIDLQIAYLRELGAVTLVAVGELRVAVLAERGREHLEKVTPLPGVREA